MKCTFRVSLLAAQMLGALLHSYPVGATPTEIDFESGPVGEEASEAPSPLAPSNLKVHFYSTYDETRCLSGIDRDSTSQPFAGLSAMSRLLSPLTNLIRHCTYEGDLHVVATAVIPTDDPSREINVLLDRDGNVLRDEESIQNAEGETGLEFDSEWGNSRPRTQPYWTACVAYDKYWGPIICPYNNLPGSGETITSLFTYDILQGLAYHRFGCSMYIDGGGTPHIVSTPAASSLPYYDYRVDWYMEFDGFDANNLCDHNWSSIWQMTQYWGPNGGRLGYIGYIRNGEIYRRHYGYTNYSYAGAVTKNTALTYFGCRTINSPTYCGATYDIMYSRSWNWNTSLFDAWLAWTSRSGYGNSDCAFKKVIQRISLYEVTPPVMSPCW